MASGRLIYKTFHTNEQLSDLNVEQRYLYLSLIVHSDDDGRMKAEPKFIKALVFPFDFELRTDTLQESLCALHNAKLIVLYLVDGKQYLYHPNWTKWQPLRKDRYKPSDCPAPDRGKQLDNQMATECKPSDTITQPNLTQPNQTRLKEQPSAPVDNFSKAFIEKADKAKKDGFNIYALSGKFYKQSKVVKKLPERVLDSILDDYFLKRETLTGDPWPYFKKVLYEKSRDYFANENQEEHKRLKKEPFMAADVLRNLTVGAG